MVGDLHQEGPEVKELINRETFIRRHTPTP